MSVFRNCVSACFCFACFSIASGQDVAPQALERAKAELHKAVDSGEAAGCSHMVCRNGEVVYFEIAGVRDIDAGTPLTADTIMRIYSMTKPITSVAAMTLFEQGKFELDDPISKFIPTFEETMVFVKDGPSHRLVPSDRPLTVRDLFRHTAGYGYGAPAIPELHRQYVREGLMYRPPAAMMPPSMSIAKAADVLARIPTLHQPGKRFTYGFNSDLLGRLIEVWSGDSLDGYMKSSVLEPLEMVDTGFSVPADRRDRFASCHTTADGKIGIVDKAADSPFNEGFEFLSGGGGLVSTMRDYANFCQMLVDGGQYKGKRILKSSTLQLMFTDQLDEVPGDFRFGLGFAIADIDLGSGDQKRKVTQYSWGGYASTDFRVVPEEKLFQIIMRQRIPSKHDLAGRMFPIVYQGVR